MKSKEIQPSAYLLTYQLSPKKQAELEQIIQQFELQCKPIDQSDLSQTVGYLAGVPGYDKAEHTTAKHTCESEFILFCGLSKEQMNRVLKRMREQKLFVALKAVVTPHNRDWTLHHLLIELENEYQFVKLNEEYEHMLKQAEKSGQKSVQMIAKSIKEEVSIFGAAPKEIQKAIDRLNKVLMKK